LKTNNYIIDGYILFQFVIQKGNAEKPNPIIY
jgi:hypothetical protein